MPLSLTGCKFLNIEDILMLKKEKEAMDEYILVMLMDVVFSVNYSYCSDKPQLRHIFGQMKDQIIQGYNLLRIPSDQVAHNETHSK